MADARSSAPLERWLSIATTVLAPATVLSTLLFYFGYVSSRAQFAYFGVDVDTIGLSTQDYVMRSPQPLLVPLLVLTVLAVAALLLHSAIARRITEPDPEGQSRKIHYRQLARRAVGIGLAVLAGGMLLLLCYPFFREWTLFALVTPVLIASGAAVAAYGFRIQARLQPSAPVSEPGSSEPGGAHAENSLMTLRRYAGGALVVVILANLFWATATIAQWSGRGLAHYNATHLNRLPSVVLDTRERLFLRSPGIGETALPMSAGQTFRYRYRHLRLLIQGKDRMFLVPDQWSASDSTLIMPLDGTVRVQFQFENDPP